MRRQRFLSFRVELCWGANRQRPPYTASIVTSGGVPPFTWTKTSGNFPSGLTFNTTSGQFTGTPITAGTSQFTLQVVDSAIPPQTATTPAPLSITVNALTALQVTPSVLPGGSVATPYSTSVQATGGVQPYTWSVAAGQLPAGLSLNPSSGQITGTPILVSGTPVSFTLSVQDSETVPVTVSRGFSISITAGSGNPNSLLRGAYAFSFSGFDTQGVVLATGQFTTQTVPGTSAAALKTSESNCREPQLTRRFPARIRSEQNGRTERLTPDSYQYSDQPETHGDLSVGSGFGGKCPLFRKRYRWYNATAASDPRRRNHQTASGQQFLRRKLQR